jgi:hypothetical protein
MSYNLFIWTNQSNGDTLGIIPVLELLFKTYPDVKVRFACYEDQMYLVKHLPMEFFPIKGNYRNIPERVNFFKKIDPLFYEGYTTIHLWGGLYSYPHTWVNQVKTFNNQCKEKNIELLLDESTCAFVELPHIDLDVKNNAVYVENGPTVSGHSYYNFDIYKLSLMFPKTNFYLTDPVNFSANNIIDCSKKNLIELANISKKCQLILGKGSGPFMCAYNETNKDKGMYLLGFWHNYSQWNDLLNVILLNNEEEMINLIRPINRQK